MAYPKRKVAASQAQMALFQNPLYCSGEHCGLSGIAFSLLLTDSTINAATVSVRVAIIVAGTGFPGVMSHNVRALAIPRITEAERYTEIKDDDRSDRW